MRILWESHPNPDVRTLHVDVEVPRFSTGSFGKFWDHDLKNMTDAAKDMGFALMAILGVTDTYSRKYSISVSKGKAFDWPPIMAEVEQIAAKSLAPGDNIEPHDIEPFDDDI